MTRANSEATTYSRHFYSLDALRGLAALCIIFYHWRHFFYVGTVLPPYDEARQPFFSVLQPLYTSGWRAVDLFFCLSGFIFFWLYSGKIAGRTVSAREFVVLRFSRLYPLHFVTLIIVGVGQLLMIAWFGTPYVYHNTDLYHFVLQLFFVYSWGFERGLSFNGPTWSVSIEVLLYAVFFLICFLRLNRWWWLVLFASLSVIPNHFGLPEMSRGVLSFFVGGLTYAAFLLLWQRGLTVFHVAIILATTVLIWIDIPFTPGTNILFDGLSSSAWHDRLLVHHKDVVGGVLLILGQNCYELFLFPATILTLAVVEAYRGTLGKRVAFLGDISYAVYLLHFPLQLTFMFIALSLALPNTIFYSPWLMLGFFGLLIALSLGSYHFLERPAQRSLRTRLLPARRS